MARSQLLPQLGGDFYLTDGGIETTLIFLEGLELAHFAAFDLLKDARGEAALRTYFGTYARLAERFQTGLVLESATWRASADWGAKLGYDAKEMAAVNRRAVELLERVKSEHRADRSKVVISGCVGPRGDGYNPSAIMSAQEAQRYHAHQIRVFEDSAADMVTAITMNYVNEALGVAAAAERAGMPVAIAFTVETDARLPTGEPLREAIEAVDRATSRYPAYYMINCAHPAHFGPALEVGEPWTARVRGLRANASRKSHAELNESADLDIGDPAELGAEHAALKRKFSALNVMGGCCGTDHRHIEEIARSCRPLFP
jgi:S-methylmethionine-dependent homocysteine/selenocysteine methylase